MSDSPFTGNRRINPTMQISNRKSFSNDTSEAQQVLDKVKTGESRFQTYNVWDDKRRCYIVRRYN